MKALATAVALLAAFPAQAADWRFCWVGDGGFRMIGRMSYHDAAAEKGLITEADITAFSIKGFQKEKLVGRWTLDMLTPDTSWQLNFLPAEGRFPVGGPGGSYSYQAWNADGMVSDCGTPGFGFNSGTNEQDLCINGRYYPESGIARFTPLTASKPGEPLGCDAPEFLSLLHRTPRG